MSNETENTGSPSPPTGHRAEELAAEAVRLAKLELEKAERFYEDVRRKAEEKIAEVREKKVGDLVDATLDAVKKFPGSSLIVSVALGYCMGRWIQKMLGK